MRAIAARVVCTALGTLLLVLGLVVSAEEVVLEIAIQVSPNVLNIQSEGEVVTVHTDIPYGAVNVETADVFLNGVPISSYKSDNRGYFVAKFLMEAIKELPFVEDAPNDLTMTGFTIDGQPFIGSDEVVVVDRIPRGR